MTALRAQHRSVKQLRQKSYISWTYLVTVLFIWISCIEVLLIGIQCAWNAIRWHCIVFWQPNNNLRRRAIERKTRSENHRKVAIFENMILVSIHRLLRIKTIEAFGVIKSKPRESYQKSSPCFFLPNSSLCLFKLQFFGQVLSSLVNFNGISY